MGSDDKSTYEQKMEARLRELDAEMELLQAKADRLEADAREQNRTLLDDLAEQRNELAERLQTYRESAGSAGPRRRGERVRRWNSARFGSIRAEVALMYIRLARLRRFTATTPRETLGNVDALYFDQEDWAVRFVSLTNRSGRAGLYSALVSPLCVSRIRPDEEALDVDLLAEAYELAQSELHKSIDPRATIGVLRHYRLPAFWRGERAWGDHASPAELARSARKPDLINGHPITDSPPKLYPHSMLMGREVFSPDGQLGVVSDLLVDLSTWRIRYFIVWLQAPGESGEVLLSPFWVNGPPQKPRVTVPMTTEAVVNGPNFVAEDLEPLDEQILARYFGFLKE
ncbi:MAG: hypothetical protein ACOC2N_01960 [Spirochaetota bacterium]